MATTRSKAAGVSDGERAGILALKMVCRLAVQMAPVRAGGSATFRQIATQVYPLVSHDEVDEIERILAAAYPPPPG